MPLPLISLPRIMKRTCRSTLLLANVFISPTREAHFLYFLQYLSMIVVVSLYNLRNVEVSVCSQWFWQDVLTRVPCFQAATVITVVAGPPPFLMSTDAVPISQWAIVESRNYAVCEHSSSNLMRFWNIFRRRFDCCRPARVSCRHWIRCRFGRFESVIFFSNPVERIMRMMSFLKGPGSWDDSEKSGFGSHIRYPNRLGYQISV